MEGIEVKIQKIEDDLAKNKKLITDIKSWVGLLANGDDQALGHLVKLVGDQSADTGPGAKKEVSWEIPAWLLDSLTCVYVCTVKPRMKRAPS